ncbi:MAG TPA: SufD family Fe-S cluster assembly protein [Methanosarcina barkeri]|nr:SufD family Fe-S cluster assembly protein [Methanosarcina barkeri]
MPSEPERIWTAWKSSRITQKPKPYPLSLSIILWPVTHEAAIGCVDKKEIETLMARGLEEDDSIDIIVKGMLA